MPSAGRISRCTRAGKVSAELAGRLSVVSCVLSSRQAKTDTGCRLLIFKKYLTKVG